MGAVRPAVVLVAALALTAGCAGLFGDRGAGTAGTVTPAPVPSATPSPSPDGPVVVGGSDGSREVNETALLASDRRVRSNSAYRFERTVTVRSADGTMRLHRIRKSGTDGRVVETLNVTGSGQFDPVIDRAALWSNGTAVRSRARLAGGRVLVDRPASDTANLYGRGLDLPRRVLTRTDLRARERTAAGLVLVSADEPELSGSFVPLSTSGPENSWVRLTVSERGVIRSLRLNYETSVDGTVVAVGIRQRVSRVNETTVTRPAWVNRIEERERSRGDRRTET